MAAVCGIRRGLADAFADAQGMHTKKKVPPHQAVAATTRNIEPQASRDDYARMIGIDIRKSLEEVLPFPILVKFIEHNYRQLIA